MTYEYKTAAWSGLIFSLVITQMAIYKHDWNFLVPFLMGLWIGIYTLNGLYNYNKK